MDMIGRREFVAMGAAFAASSVVGAAAGSRTSAERGLLVRFLGSGGSRWNPEWEKMYECARRQSSMLVENRLLFDFTYCGFDKLPADVRPKALFATHSHGDHFDPVAIVKVGVERVYVHSSWAKHARTVLGEASAKCAAKAPEVIPLEFGRSVEAEGMTVTAVPANHATSLVTDGVLERPALYLIERGETRLLYATDTGGIPADAARMIGIDIHVNDDNYETMYAGNPFVSRPKAITALVMEATNGKLDDDFRLFTHSSIQQVERTVAALKATKRFLPPAGQRAYITHLGMQYRHMASKKIEAEMSKSLAAAYDGLEIRLG